jgi:hypothetical protein
MLYPVKSNAFRRRLVLALIVLASAALPGRTRAAFLFTLSQVGGNVVVTGSGSFNITGLTLRTNTAVETNTYPTFGVLFAGAATSVNDDQYFQGGLAGPSSFGTGTQVFANSGSGSVVGIEGSNLRLDVPTGYVSGTELTETSTYTGKTFATLGFTPGTYTYTWGSGPTADSLTITSVPEPSTWALLGVGAGLLGGWGRKKRQK